MKIAIVGGGLIGTERIEAIKRLAVQDPSIELACLVDPSEKVRAQVETKHQVLTCPDLGAVLSNRPDWIVVCTPHDVAPAIAMQALEAGANVLIEKPIGRTLAECDAIIAKKPPNAKLNVGFNYRFYPGIEAAVLDAKNGRFGKVISVNITLGHGNSPGMEKSWKLDRQRCGGGCLIDPGVHALDLVLLLATDGLSVNAANGWTGFWKTGIEEEAHLLLTDSQGVIFNVQLSLDRWRSTFRLEINGTDGYGWVEGRGRSYGPQSYRVGRRWGWQAGVPQAESEIAVVDRNPANDSFVRETAFVLGLPQEASAAANGQSLPPCSHADGRNVMELLSRVQRVLQ